MGSLSLAHWLIVLVVVLLIFGPTKLAAVGKGLGEGIRNFKKGISGDDEKDQVGPREHPDPKSLPPPRDQKPS
jgi:sec-independent protein translocase protein TatA